MGSDGQVRISTALDNKGFTKGIQKLGTGMKSLNGICLKLAKTMAMLFGVRALVNFGKKAVEVGSNIAEVQNVVDTAFGNMRQQAEDFAATAIESFGLSELQAKQTASSYMAMARGMGVAEEEAANMAIALAGMSGDVASFYNLDAEDAATKLKSVFTGETETLKSLGVVMTETNLETYALSQGITKAYKNMTQAEKVSLRYSFVMDSLSMASGDFVRTQDSWANQTRILSMQWEQFSGILGQTMISIILPAVRALNSLVGGLTRAATALNGAVNASKGNVGLDGTASAAKTAAQDIAEVTDAQTDLTDAIDDTTAAQKNAIAGFDEINKIGSADSGASIGVDLSGLNTDALQEMATTSPDDSTVENWQGWGYAINEGVETVRSKIPALTETLNGAAQSINGWSDSTYEALTFPGLKENVAGLASELAGALNEFISNINWEQLGGIFGAGLTLLITFGANWLKNFDWVGLGENIGEWINGAVSNIDWANLGYILWEKVGAIIETLAGIIQGTDWRQVAAGLSQAIGGFFDGVSETISSINWALIGYQIIEFIAGIDWGLLLEKICSALGAALAGLADFLGGIAVGLAKNFILPFLSFFGEKIQEAEDAGLGFVGGLLNAIGSVFSNIAQWIWDHVAAPLIDGFFSAFGLDNASGAIYDLGITFINTMLDGLAYAGQGILDFFGNIWKGIQGVFSHVTDWFKNVFSGAWNAVKNVFSVGGKIFDGIKDGILTAFKTVVNGLITGINKVIATPFNGINNALKLIKGISIAGLKPFDFIQTISVPQIPKLAQGAVIPSNREFLAVLGDQKNGRNLEAPEGLIREIFASEISKLAPILQEMLQVMQAGQILQVDKRVLASVTSQAITSRARTGAAIPVY